MKVDVVYIKPYSVGYYPMHYMAMLAAELLEGNLIVLPNDPVSRLKAYPKLFLPRRRGGNRLLLICPSGHNLKYLFEVYHWRDTYRRIVAWVFDSFWIEAIPRFFRYYPLDHLFVTEMEDINVWRKATGIPVDWAPWGADVLRFGSSNPERLIDIQRVGRQPEPWADDDTTNEAANKLGIRFRGRPKFGDDFLENQKNLYEAFSSARYTLSFSNTVSPSSQTHPTRQYITGRWTDAIAAGATVAGIAPVAHSVERILWPEALLELGTVDLQHGLLCLKSACKDWRPELALINYMNALERLDWRWRFRDIAMALDLYPNKLKSELDEIRIKAKLLNLNLPI